MYLILQAEKPDNYVLATGITTSIRDFCKKVFARLDMDLEFIGSGLDEKGIDKKTGKIVIEVDPRYFRPAEVDLLLGDSSKARNELNWKPKYNLDMLIDEMVENDFELAEKERMLKENGYKVYNSLEI